MLLGIFSHGLLLNPNFEFLSDYWNSKGNSVVLEVCHTFRMPLFFVLSGFMSCLLFNKRGFSKFLVSRSKRILIPFILSIFSIGFVTNILLHNLVLLHERPNLAGAKFDFSMQYFRFEDFRLTHLWFLYVLMLVIPITAGLHILFSRIHAKAYFSKRGTLPEYCLRSRFSFLIVLAVPLAIILNIGSNNGNPTPQYFVVPFIDLAPYLFYFVFGWVLKHHETNLHYFTYKPKKFLLLGIGLTLLRLFIWSFYGLGNMLLLNFIFSLSLWCYIYSLIGIVLTYFEKPAPCLQYFSDASYWIYLVHYPVILFIKPFFLNGVSVPVFFILLLAVLIISVISYNYLVRPTFIGRILNGKRLPSIPFISRLRTVASAKYTYVNNKWRIGIDQMKMS